MESGKNSILFDLDNSLDGKNENIINSILEDQTIIIHLNGLNTNLNSNHLFDILSKIGVLKSFVSKLTINKKEKNLGYSICFDNNECCIELINMLKNLIDFRLSCRPLSIEIFTIENNIIEKRESNLILKNLPYEMTDSYFFKTINLSGKVVSQKLVKDKSSNSLGFGFVQYEKLNSYETIGNIFSKVSMKGKIVSIQHRPFKERRGKNSSRYNNKFTNVYIEGIRYAQINNPSLQKLFSIFGIITSIFIPIDNGIAIGHGCVNFHKNFCAENAIFKMDNKNIRGCFLYVVRAEKKKWERETIINKKIVAKKTRKFTLKNGNIFFIKAIFCKILIDFSIYLKSGIDNKRKLSLKMVAFEKNSKITGKIRNPIKIGIIGLRKYFNKKFKKNNFRPFKFSRFNRNKSLRNNFYDDKKTKKKLSPRIDTRKGLLFLSYFEIYKLYSQALKTRNGRSNLFLVYALIWGSEEIYNFREFISNGFNNGFFSYDFQTIIIFCKSLKSKLGKII